jgi:hypothetical protein
MRKRNLQKAVVLLVCFAFLGLSASGLSAAPRKSSQLSFKMLINEPGLFLVTLIPALRNIIKVDPPAQVQPTTSNSSKLIKTTGTIKSIRLSGGD